MTPKPRFWCLFPGCQGCLPDGSDLWQHAEQHLERRTLELDAWGERERRRIERRAARMGLALRRREP